MIIEGDFERDGAVCVRAAVDAEHVELARHAIDANLADLSPRAKRASADDDGAFIEDFGNWPRLPAMERFIRDSGVAGIAGGLMGSETVRLYHDHVLVKEPGTRQRTPWHQDQPYYNVDGRQNASLWFPVDPVPRASTLEFVAGSHRGEWYMPRTFLDHEAKWFPDGTLAELPDIDGRPDDVRILGWELEPGDAVFFHMLTLHAAGGVGGANRRRVLSVRFLGDDMVHAPRPWTTSPPFPGLVDELPRRRADGSSPVPRPLDTHEGARPVTEPIDYIELPGGDLAATKGFYAAAFGWGFQDYGPDYAALQDAGLDGGFDATTATGTAPLVILKAADLEGALARVEAAGGVVVDPIFEFPGGRRFHFRDPAGNVLGVWGE